MSRGSPCSSVSEMIQWLERRNFLFSLRGREEESHKEWQNDRESSWLDRWASNVMLMLNITVVLLTDLWLTLYGRTQNRGRPWWRYTWSEYYLLAWGLRLLERVLTNLLGCGTTNWHWDLKFLSGQWLVRVLSLDVPYDIQSNLVSCVKCTSSPSL